MFERHIIITDKNDDQRLHFHSSSVNCTNGAHFLLHTLNCRCAGAHEFTRGYKCLPKIDFQNKVISISTVFGHTTCVFRAQGYRTRLLLV